MFYLITAAYILFLVLWRPQPISLKAKPQGYWENIKSVKATLILGVILSITFLLTSGFGFEKTSNNFAILGTSKEAFLKLNAYFQIVTSNFIHINLLHLVSNLAAILYLSNYERRVGSGRYIVVFILSGIFGFLAGMPFTDSSAAGASAGIFGLAAAHFTDHRNLSKKEWLYSILAFAFISIILSLPDKSSESEGYRIHHWGHFFGAVGGIIFCRLFPIPETDGEIRKRKKFRIAVAIAIPTFVVLSLIPFVMQMASYGKKTQDCASLYSDKKYEEAFEFCSKAIGPVAEGMTAHMYLTGNGVTQDKKKAFEITKNLAFRGDVNAQYTVAYMYYRGDGVTKNHKRAYKWGKLAAEQNHVKAQLLLSEMSVLGRGVGIDYKNAYMWLKLAENIILQGKSLFEPDVDMKKVKADISERLLSLGKKLTSEQLVDANKNIKEWKPSYKEEDLAALYKEEMSGKSDNKEEEPELSDSPEMAQLCKYYYSRKNYEEAIGKCEESSDQNAQKLTAVMYATGQGVEKNSEKAVEVINRSGNGDKITAFYDFVGTMYYYDEDRDGVKKDHEEAIKWYRRAAEAGDVKNQMRLAVWHYKGLFTAKKDFEESFKWAKMAAKQEHPQAQAMMVVFYGSGTGGVFKDDFHSTWWLKKLVESVKLSNTDKRYTDDEKKGALHWLRQFGLTECPHIIMKLAAMYTNGGWGVEPIPMEGFGWYYMLSNAGYADAKAQLGVLYFLGKDNKGKVDKKKAVELLTEAANDGSAFAQRQLGNFYNMGDGVKKDIEKSIEWSTKAAENGDSYAQQNLGYTYFQNKDYKNAFKWLLVATNQNVAQPQATIADMYSAGLGVEKDYVQSYMWRSLALENQGKVLDRPGKRDALPENVQKLLKQKIIDLTNNMSKEHVEIAKKIATAWKPNKNPNTAILSVDRLRGDEYFRARDYGNAIKAYSKAIEEKPNDAVSYNHRGLLYKVMEKYEEALADLNKAIELDSKYVRAYNNRGVIHRRMDNFDKAIADYDKAAELNPFDGRSYSNRGVLYGQLGDMQLEFASLQDGLTLAPENAILNYNMGNYYHALNPENKQVMEYYDNYLKYVEPDELDNKSQYLYFSKASNYFAKGKYDLAVQNYKKGMAYGNTEFRVYLALVSTRI
ncbi:MAG: rhomboid family intramembrane serine protease [Proteobacteria bacterium]|nr:rhomboid family intramembrane serine protease [Pseudomonadota bacterium]MDA0967339.1 rhomboid family intramembrane serine protease [Pseudomonadota bacterium]